MSPISTLGTVEAQARRRIDTDRILSYSTYILWFVVLTLLTLVGGIIVAFVSIYRLLQRRNDHFERQVRLFEQILGGLRESGDQRHTHLLDEADAIINRMRLHWSSKDPMIWAVVLPIVTLGIAGFWTQYWLTVDWRRHSELQRQLTDAFSNIFREIGYKSPSIIDEGMTPERNYWLYLALSLLTFGLFSIYWWYLLFKDGNDHLKSDAFMEDQLLNALRIAS